MQKEKARFQVIPNWPAMTQPQSRTSLKLLRHRHNRASFGSQAQRLIAPAAASAVSTTSSAVTTAAARIGPAWAIATD
jgi:hypothetical protein